MHFSNFKFLEPGVLVDGDLKLVLEKCVPADPSKNYVPAYEFKMCVGDSSDKIGHVNFRAGSTSELIFIGGHLGYGVDSEYRGRQLAERACRLLIPFIKQHGFSEIWITCNPDNYASRKTCERLGAELVEIVDVPLNHEMYKDGDRQKCRFRLEV